MGGEPSVKARAKQQGVLEEGRVTQEERVVDEGQKGVEREICDI